MGRLIKLDLLFAAQALTLSIDLCSIRVASPTVTIVGVIAITSDKTFKVL